MYDIETEHYNSKNEKIDINEKMERIREIVSDIVMSCVHQEAVTR